MSDTNEKCVCGHEEYRHQNPGCLDCKCEWFNGYGSIGRAPAPPPSATCPPTPHGLYECPAVHPDNKLPRADGEAGKVRRDMAQEALDRLVVISTGWRVERDALRERIVALTEGDDSLAARADKAEAEVERLTKALREIIFGIERHDDTDGGWMPMNATEVVAIARRALRPTHNTGEGE